jgi:hypothetical protein
MRSVVNGLRHSSASGNGFISPSASFTSHGESTGGNAEDAVTARASSIFGASTKPTCQSARRFFVNRNRLAVCTLVAQNTNRGTSGRSCNVASPNRTFLYCFVTRSEADTPGRRAPTTTDDTSIDVPAIFRSGSTTSDRKLVAMPAASKPRLRQASASTPAVMDPPETLEILVSFGSQPISLSRHSTPTWKIIAR